MSAVKARARAKNLQFNLDLEYLTKQYENQGGVCAITRIRFNSDSESRISPYSLSIDRITAKEGYVKGNIQLILLAVNFAKNDWDVQELVPIWEAMSKCWVPCTQVRDLNGGLSRCC